MKIKLFTIPNIITCLNLLSGCGSIVAAFNGDFKWAFFLIIIAAIFDFFDGFTARLLKSYSAIGKELDSLADIVSFGVAPAVMLFCLLGLNSETGAEKYIVFIVAAFSALRLAKFNIDDRQSTDFIGLPTPANAMFISSLAYLAAKGESGILNYLVSVPWITIGLAIIFSILLVSEIRMFSLKFSKEKNNDQYLRYIFLLVSLILIIAMKVYAIPSIIILYIIISLVRNFFGKKPDKSSVIE